MQKDFFDDIFDPGEAVFWLFWLTLPLHFWISLPALLIWGLVELL